MRLRYKLLIIILLLWLGMSYEGARDGTYAPRNTHNATLEEQIRLYELGLIDNDPTMNYATDSAAIPSDTQGNWFARSGRNIGNALQTAVREILRGLVRFFDGIIT